MFIKWMFLYSYMVIRCEIYNIFYLKKKNLFIELITNGNYFFLKNKWKILIIVLVINQNKTNIILGTYYSVTIYF